MVAIRIDPDELYPYYVLCPADDCFGDLVDVSEERLAEWRRVIGEFRTVQADMATARREAMVGT